MKFSPSGELLLTIGTPGEIGDPPTHLTDPNDVLIAPNGRIFIAETHGAQFQSEPGDDSKSRITIWEPDGTYVGSFGEFGWEDGQFRSPHSLAMDSQGRLFVADRGNNRIQIFTQDGEWLDTWYQFSRISGLHIDPSNDMLYATITPVAGGKACESATPETGRFTTLCLNMCPRSVRPEWAELDPWARVSPLTATVMFTPVR